jgi:hypothetical protein
MNKLYFSPLLLLLFISILVLACTSTRKDTKEGKCFVSVQINNVPDTTYAKVAWLHQKNEFFEIEEIDSIPVINGLFSFECSIERLTSASICINKNYMRIYLEPGDITVNLDGSAPYLVSQSGTSVDNELEVVNNYLLENSKRSINDCFNQYGGYCYHTERYDLIEHRKTIKQRQSLLLNFIRSHIDYRIVPDLLHQVLLLYDYESLGAQQIESIIHDIQDIYSDIPSENRNSDDYEMVGWEIKQILCAATANEHIGGNAPDFQCRTTDGKQFRLYNYLGEGFVLLHFGGDVRDESQKLSDYYNIPKLKIISITHNCMPNDEKAFSQFVQDRWPVSQSVNDWSYHGMRLLSPACIYHVIELPTCVLISPSGTIIEQWNGRQMPTGKNIKDLLKSYSNNFKWEDNSYWRHSATGRRDDNRFGSRIRNQELMNKNYGKEMHLSVIVPFVNEGQCPI